MSPERAMRPERYIKNPFHILRSLADLAVRPIVAVDEALAEFNETRPYNDTLYPLIRNVEAPVSTEEELMTGNDSATVGV